MTKAIDVLKKNGNGQVHCYRGRSGVFYIPRRFSNAFTKLSDILKATDVPGNSVPCRRFLE